MRIPMVLVVLGLIFLNPVYADESVTDPKKCVDLSGDYSLEYPIVGWVADLAIDQTECGGALLGYLFRNGMKLQRKLELDGKKRESRKDPQEDLVDYESATIDETGVTVLTETFIKGEFAARTVQTFRFNPQGHLIDRGEEFDSKGKSQGPVSFTYKRK